GALLRAVGAGEGRGEVIGEESAAPRLVRLEEDAPDALLPRARDRADSRLELGNGRTRRARGSLQIEVEPREGLVGERESIFDRCAAERGDEKLLNRLTDLGVESLPRKENEDRDAP